MGKGVTPERAIWLTKLGVALVCSWPPSPCATRARRFLFDAAWCGQFASSVALLLPLLRAIYEHRKDPVILGKTVCLASAVAQVTIKMTICRLQRKQFQVLCRGMERFCRDAGANERRVLQRHVDRYKYFYGVYILWCFLTAAFVISGPLYTHQTFPTPAIYPFPVNGQPVKSLVFLHQSLVGFQVSSGMAIDVQASLLLRYTAARFELLCYRLRDARIAADFDACAQQHAELLSYSRGVRRSVGFLILATIATTAVGVIFGSLNLVADQPLLLKGLYAAVVLNASIELFLYAWSANNLMRMSEEPATAAYNTSWVQGDNAIRKKVLFIIMRSQKREAVRISGIVPELSLPYYGRYLYASLSYFTALRIMMDPSASNAASCSGSD